MSHTPIGGSEKRRLACTCDGHDSSTHVRQRSCAELRASIALWSHDHERRAVALAHVISGWHASVDQPDERQQKL